MARKHYKKRKKKDKPAQDHIRGVTQMMVDPPPVAEPKQISRGESMRPATHGGYRHTFSYYEVTIPAKGKGTCY